VILAAVLGADVSKSRSPAIHEAAFAALGVAGRYDAVSVAPPDFEAKVAELRRAGYRYLNVTIPHKLAAAALADAQGPEVQVSGAANTLLLEDSAVRAENTDGAGLIAALADMGFAPAGQTVVMVGAGGAAAGAVEALTRAGAQVRLLARRPEAAAELRDRLPASQRARVVAGGWAGQLGAALSGAGALVSAVPAAGWSGPDERAGLGALESTTVVLEMAYGGVTPLAAAVAAQRAPYADGLGMLAHQAARAVELALGRLPPVEPLLRAARGG
jgi:shikimate dehydrogenase